MLLPCPSSKSLSDRTLINTLNMVTTSLVGLGWSLQWNGLPWPNQNLPKNIYCWDLSIAFTVSSKEILDFDPHAKGGKYGFSKLLSHFF